ncbi:cytochrome O ubiquinol oxidase [Pediococcus acidilactici]|uniref:SNARE-like domain protein n=1 Tax=Pediococcus acidilactici DSM 20284 TaxID=862514 RepID=E0NFQ7_PEDAC|nr:VTT domain-containing protein [Pediococcus acidilactici]AZP90967.1 cytochrome O ubiquinol oxidase [Pediococcus acidilactici]EFL95626.1 SNARE-like domain protein [Pediococcus acidilactici DSM 20284]KAF0370632.1 cytochrome O ubiquinol oxidase [Pediococcus acidilactici]KAF0389430.1 cytochrome O ubiquinol oxidase [Pediococcus acidilactici]KRN16317.1 DedA family membrane protein [Pediococcus acidilactici]
MQTLIDFVLHIDEHLVTIVNNFGNYSYLILFAIIFIETGAVILPFLPGDSLLFAATALSAKPVYGLNVWAFIILFSLAALLGDSLNFFLGKHVGMALRRHPFFGKFISDEKMDEAQQFFEKHGNISITLARFMPIIRTFAPFVAAGANMPYRSFIRYNIVGNFAWVAVCCGAGYFFGNIPFVKEHFSLVVIGIIVVSLIPAIISFIKSKSKKQVN